MRHLRSPAVTDPDPTPASSRCPLAPGATCRVGPRRQLRRWPGLCSSVLALALLASAAGCSDEERQYSLRDAAQLLDGQVSFLGLCQSDSDCTSGRCLTLGQTSRCSRACSSQAACPQLEGWSCDGEGYCNCSIDAATEIGCTTDNDCDGIADKIATTESCNGEDDDCNGLVDDVAPGTAGAALYYPDVDEDGYGDTYSARWLCAPEPGWISQSGDCDDSDPTVNPEQPEICGDNKDNDCDGYVDNTEVCGRLPVQVSDVNGTELSGTLTTCSAGDVNPAALDITEIVAKQDSARIKYTVRVAGHPGDAVCSSYVLHLGDPYEAYRLAYVYRPTGDVSCSSLPTLEAFIEGVPLQTAAVTSFLANAPGHVAFIIPKSEIFPELGQPSYQLKACSNAVSDPQTDYSTCSSDHCETAVRRN